MDFADIPMFADFLEVTALDRYAELPADWAVAVADVRGSTAAIREGRYKDVNLLAVSAIAAMVNAVKPVRIPFVFGGDGASFCVPPSSATATRHALASVRTLGRDVFGLDLRIGLVPVSTLLARGRRVLVANFRSSPTCVQSVFAGGGMSLAERLVKDPAEGAAYAVAGTDASADCTGLECRWNEIASPHGETVALLVQATGGNPRADSDIYHSAIAAVSGAYGDAQRSHPVSLDHLVLGRGPAAVRGEVAVRTHHRGGMGRILYGMKVRAEQMLGRVLLKTGARFAGVDWGRYREEVIHNTDHRKFDDTLRLLLSGTAGEREALEAWMAQQHAAGRLAYGLHVAPSALMTCLIGDRSAGDHIHFVDGAHGGYALAAVDLKRRLGSMPEIPAA
ncbi:MAG: DUF3095 domain-containing protein [Verrucomicrobiales bacterium]|nr:DUF3095 domain-containing protein [Verrucomicrobiales bacterium]